MTGQMIEFDAAGGAAPGYLAKPDAFQSAPQPGVVVLHAWWGLTEPFRQVCDRLAQAGFVAFAPDLYRSKSASTIEEAEALATSLNREQERVNGDIRGAVQFLSQHAHPATPADGPSALGVVGFSMGGAYALDMSVTFADQIQAVVTFYATYTGLEFRRAQAAYLCHFAEDDPYEPAESVEQLKQELRTAEREATFYTYPGTTHWFVEANRPDAYNPAAAALAWERTIAFLNAQLRRP